MPKKKEDYSKFFFIFFTLFMVVITFLVIRPFIAPLLASVFFAYLFYPIYKWLLKWIRNRYACSLIVTLVIIAILIVPTFFIINTLTKEAYVNYLTTKQKILGLGAVFKTCNPQTPFCGFISYMGIILDDPQVKYHLQDSLEGVSSYVVNNVAGLIFSIPRLLLNFFIMTFTLFYLLIDGPSIIQGFRNALPLRDIYKRHLFEKFGMTIHAIAYGYIVVAVIQGALGGIGFYIFGLPSPVIWGIVMMFTALIPFLGTAIVWFPAALFKLISGISSNNTNEIMMASLFMIYGAVVISSIDNLIRPKIIGDKANVHPVMILVGVFGGLYLLGSVGAIVGPLVLSLFLS